MLPTKLNSADVKGWAAKALKKPGKAAAKAKMAGGKGSKLAQRLAAVGKGSQAQDPSQAQQIDPATGLPIDPTTGLPVQPGAQAQGAPAAPAVKKKAPPLPPKKGAAPAAKGQPGKAAPPAAAAKGPPGKGAPPPAAKAAGKAAPPAKGKPAAPFPPKKKAAPPATAAKPAAAPQPPGSAKPPAEDPNAVQQKVPAKAPAPTKKAPPAKPPVTAKGAVPSQQAAPGDKSAHVESAPNTEPEDPMNAGGPGIPEELLQDDGGDDGLADADDMPPVDPILEEVEEKLGDFAEVLEDRADELEELAQEVQGDLTGDDADIDTKREVQQLIPDDIRGDLVEHLSGMSDDEIEAFCTHLQEIGRVEDPELMAAFLKAASSDSNGEDDGDDDQDEGDNAQEKGDDGGESDLEADQDE